MLLYERNRDNVPFFNRRKKNSTRSNINWYPLHKLYHIFSTYVNKKQMQWWKMLGQPVCTLLHKMSKFQRSPFCICFSWDKADASLTSFPTLVTAAKCQHPDTLHVLTWSSFQHPTGRKHPFLQKQETSACRNYFSSPVLEPGSCSLFLLPKVTWQSRREGSQTLMMCHIKASAIT